ncbi:MAG: hypothetical protein NTW38_12145 [Candidatus Aminicenantes bacterium]|nr:hypothetical protein [Candidatus Aminicenantes bacterium]
MNELEAEIRYLKEELDRKKEEISDLRKLLGREIDREFAPPVEELSDKELADYLRDTIPLINGFVETKPDIRAITSHRKTLGRPVVFLKRALLKTTFTQLNASLDLQNRFNRDQSRFNRQVAALFRTLHVRDGRRAERLKALEEKVAGYEEDLALLRNKLEGLNAAARLRGGSADEPPR